MSLDTNKHMGSGGTGFQGQGPGTAEYQIRELQGLTTKVVAGAAANTSVAVSGLGATDTIQSVVAFTGGTPSDVTATASIFAAGQMRNSVDTTGKTLVVNFYKKPTATP